MQWAALRAFSPTQLELCSAQMILDAAMEALRAFMRDTEKLKEQADGSRLRFHVPSPTASPQHDYMEAAKTTGELQSYTYIYIHIYLYRYTYISDPLRSRMPFRARAPQYRVPGDKVPVPLGRDEAAGANLERERHAGRPQTSCWPEPSW